MRILNLLPSLSGGGAERQLNYLTAELYRLGYEIHIAYINDGTHKPEYSGIVLHRINSRSNYDPKILFQIVRLARRLKPDIIHTWIPQMDIIGGVAAIVNSIPWIIREPNQALAYAPSWKNRLRARLGSFSSAIVSNSRGGDEYWKNKSSSIPHFIVSNALPIDEISGTEAALPLELSKITKSILLFASRMEEHKRPKVFLDAIAYVMQRKNIVGIMCGEGSLRSELNAYKHELGLDADVHFTGQLPTAAVWALMKKASIFVSLSTVEGCPNTVMEAMACGCPLVVSDIPAHREILDENCALFVEPSNIHQTADAIVQALNNVDISKSRALIAKQRAQAWTIAKMAGNYERVYKEIIGRGKRFRRDLKKRGLQ